MPSTDKIKDRLEKLDLEKAELKGQLDRDRLMAATNTVIETITSQEFVEKCAKLGMKPKKMEVTKPLQRY